MNFILHPFVFAFLWSTAVVSAQVLLVSPQHVKAAAVSELREPTIAPVNCPCKVCKCQKCECNKEPIKPVVSVKKTYSPQEASVVVRATKGNEAFQCSGTAICDHTILTCWHVTRGDGWTYTVNGKPATLLRSDSKSDVALFTTEEQLKPVSVASEPLKAGEACTAYGYEFHRTGLWKFPTRINAVNRYRGFPNVSIFGRPARGRSGGGLFNSKGELIGVCSAADGQEGLYCGLAAVQALINTPAPLSPVKTGDAHLGRVSIPSEWIQDHACKTGQCPLIKKQALAKPKAPLISEDKHKAVSPALQGACPTCPLARAGTLTRVPSSRRARPFSGFRARSCCS